MENTKSLNLLAFIARQGFPVLGLGSIQLGHYSRKSPGDLEIFQADARTEVEN